MTVFRHFPLLQRRFPGHGITARRGHRRGRCRHQARRRSSSRVLLLRPRAGAGVPGRVQIQQRRLRQQVSLFGFVLGCVFVFVGVNGKGMSRTAMGQSDAKGM